MTQDFETLRRFVEIANDSGSTNYDWCCKIVEENEDHVVVSFFDKIGDFIHLTGKLWMYNEGFMAWQEAEDEPIIFSARPWILVSITYAGP